MKKTLSLALLMLALGWAANVNAQTAGYKTSLGVRVSSSPAIVSNSITLKHFLNDEAAIEALNQIQLLD